MTEDEMAGRHHQLNELELGQSLGDGEGQGSLACFSSWGCKELDMTKPFLLINKSAEICHLLLGGVS